jgi:hypothetical protein
VEGDKIGGRDVHLDDHGQRHAKHHMRIGVHGDTARTLKGAFRPFIHDLELVFNGLIDQFHRRAGEQIASLF